MVAARTARNTLRAPRTDAERAAVEALKQRATLLVADAVRLVRERRALPEVKGSARIHDGDDGPEPVFVVWFSLSQAVDRGLEAAEAEVNRTIRDHLTHFGLMVGGVYAPMNQVWVRGPEVRE